MPTNSLKRTKKSTKAASILLAGIIILSSLVLPESAFASAADYNANAIVTDTAAYVYSLAGNIGVGQIGGEWAVMDIARSGYQVPDSFYQGYYANVEKTVTEEKGVLHKKKYTEYSRLTLALTAIGKDPRNVAGYNLLEPLADYKATIWQGINGPIWALIALDTGNYEMPKMNPAKRSIEGLKLSEPFVQATRQMYIDCILDRQLNDGGWSLTGGTSEKNRSDAADPDITGMALQALAKYQNQPRVQAAIDRALACLSKKQLSNGGFESWGTENSESCVQVMVALCELGIDVDDSRFVKNGNTMTSNIIKNYYIKGRGFRHTKDGDSNGMATEQALYGMIAVNRQANGQNSLYRMSDHINFASDAKNTTDSKPESNKNQTPAKEVNFTDLAGNKNAEAIKILAAKGIINGMDESTFAPNANMTRAQFATIVTKSMGYEPKNIAKFSDVPKSKWYAGYIGAAYNAGIINGRTASTFDPEGLITRQEAAVMVANAAKQCSMDTAMEQATIQDTLAQFSDYVTIASWATPAMAFCYANGIYDIEDLDTNPTVKITRGEIAQMLYNMLSEAMVI